MDENKILLQAILSSDDASLQKTIKDLEKALKQIQAFSTDTAKKIQEEFAHVIFFNPELILKSSLVIF